MRSARFALALAACPLLAVPAAALAAGEVHPRSGKFTGRPQYKVGGKERSASLTLIVAQGKIEQVELIGAVLPLDRRDSHGVACGSANDISSRDYRASGNVSKSGRFSYTFKNKTKSFTDRIKLIGQFTDGTHATGTFREQATIPVASSKCDTGAVEFSVRRS